MRLFCSWMLLVCALPLSAAELVFDFGQSAETNPPAGFRSAITGSGRPGTWHILMDEVPPILAPLTPQAPVVTRQPVLAQVSEDPSDEHFPLLIYEGEVFDDFTFSTRFKLVQGKVEQMAGLAFRIQNETNYYVVRASALGNTFRFYKVVDGARGTVIGPEIKIPSGEWHEMSVTCKGNEIRCALNGKEVIPPLQDNTFSLGKVGFWTKSDSVSYFAGARVVYRPREMPAKRLVQNAMKEYSRLLGLEIYMARAESETPKCIAGFPESVVGKTGGAAELDVIRRGAMYYGKEKESVSVTRPLRDKNGDPIAAVRVKMKTFAGQTEQNAIVRAMPVVNMLQGGVQNREDLTGELPVK
jgi:hypothetical protein